MLYSEKKKLIKEMALDILKKDNPKKRELTWFFNQCKKYADTADEWVTHKLE
jgi:hypothetical protein